MIQISLGGGAQGHLTFCLYNADYTNRTGSAFIASHNSGDYWPTTLTITRENQRQRGEDKWKIENRIFHNCNNLHKAFEK